MVFDNTITILAMNVFKDDKILEVIVTDIPQGSNRYITQMSHIVYMFGHMTFFRKSPNSYNLTLLYFIRSDIQLHTYI
jgi:hypothetical protein